MNSKNYFKRIALVFSFLLALTSNANNVQITGTSVTGNAITFNIRWENSWNASAAPANWDAVWVFVKYQDCNTKLWSHVNLNASGHSTASPLQIDTVSDNKGVFVRRSAVGGGNIAATSVTLSMNLPAGTYNYKVYGIEMVNIPQGAFQIGDDVSSYTYNSISIDSNAQTNGLTVAQLGTFNSAVPSTFPMGYNSFYCMKYEISQEQYADFLNSLTFTQQKNRVVTDPIAAAGSKAMYTGTGIQYRNGLAIQTPGSNGAIPAVFGCDATLGTFNGTNDGQNTAMNFLSYLDLSAYLDWAALRPMTELEYEKVCRGPETRIQYEYPWGSIELTTANSSALNNAFQANETSSTTVNNGMCVIGGPSTAAYGPLRVGALATGSSGRLSAGAGYYGVMDMGGNVYERAIGTYQLEGTSFNGTLGDGELTLTGFSNADSWPTTDSAAVGFRGGFFASSTTYARTSDRYNIINFGAGSGRVASYGGRGVR